MPAEKTLSRCACIDGSLMYGFRETTLFSFISDKTCFIFFAKLKKYNIKNK